MQKRQTFTREFKLEAVRLLERGDRPAAELARELGIKRNQLYKWQEQLSAKGEGHSGSRSSGSGSGRRDCPPEAREQSGTDHGFKPSDLSPVLVPRAG